MMTAGCVLHSIHRVRGGLGPVGLAALLTLSYNYSFLRIFSNPNPEGVVET